MKPNKNTNILDYFKNKNYKRFSLFFIAAFVLLIFSKLSSDYKQTIKVKVNLINVEDEIIIKNDSTTYIDAYVEAKGFALVPLLFNRSKELIVNSKNNVTIKGNQFIFDVQKHKYLLEGQLGNSYQLLSVMPDTLLISFSKRASKVVPVELVKNINYAVGYDLKGDFNFNTDSVKIVGSAAMVNKINSIKTEELLLTSVNQPISTSLNLDISSLENIEVFPKIIQVSGDVARFTEGIKEVPVIITNQPSNVNINYFPKTVSVSFYVDLEDYNAVKTDDFRVECNYKDLGNNQTYLLPKVVKKPSFVKRVNIRQKRIDYIKL
ncbi:hypothetical protein [uncultured Winogradskyella sp.]|uniref:hypothetical protein n=1 Tax=uncultured Winogradskyella sp. TaxID=395353 RepID=UPI002633CB57|nr:hypothetical protein [uncultured Winogradskyella sp.]|tara:strand:- start:4028 stop:4990 length:963 start_codon:yes stop_codon:yes gene_type:complete